MFLENNKYFIYIYDTEKIKKIQNVFLKENVILYNSNFSTDSKYIQIENYYILKKNNYVLIEQPTEIYYCVYFKKKHGIYNIKLFSKNYKLPYECVHNNKNTKIYKHIYDICKYNNLHTYDFSKHWEDIYKSLLTNIMNYSSCNDFGFTIFDNKIYPSKTPKIKVSKCINICENFIEYNMIPFFSSKEKKGEDSTFTFQLVKKYNTIIWLSINEIFVYNDYNNINYLSSSFSSPLSAGKDEEKEEDYVDIINAHPTIKNYITNIKEYNIYANNSNYPETILIQNLNKILNHNNTKKIEYAYGNNFYYNDLLDLRGYYNDIIIGHITY